MPILSIHVAGIPELQKQLEVSVDKSKVVDAAGTAVSTMVRRHLRARNNRPGKPGWPKSNYWGDASEGAQTVYDDKSMLMTIHAAGVRLHLKGGDVQSKSGGALALPARPEVAGIWPSEYSGKDRIFLLVRKALGKAYLAEREDGGHLRILWRLVKKAHHNEDPSVLPSEASLSEAANAAVKSVLPNPT